MTDRLREAATEFVRDYENGDMGDLKHYARALRAALAEPVPEPVFEVGFGWLIELAKYPRGTKLYTAPPTRRPLTDFEADAIAHEMVKGDKSVQWLVRAIERKITGGNDD